MNLRPYQTELIADVKSKFAKGKKRVILCAPTGAGKTVIFCKVVIDTLQKDLFNRVLIITDRIELFKQTFKALEFSGAEPELYKNQKTVSSRCVVAMVETIKRRHKNGKLNIGQFNLIIIDEAHKGNFKGIFDIYPNAFYIGATATPITTSKKDPLRNYYNEISLTVDVPDLIQDGYLNEAKSYAMVAYDEKDLKFDARKGDFTDKSLAETFSKPAIYDGVQFMFDKHCQNKKTMVFCVNIEESIKVARQLNAYCIHSKLNKEEREIQLAKFHLSKSGVMVNCGILTTGYDHPPIEVIIINRATTSLPLFLQICGRGSRLAPNKEYFTIIDMGGNIKRLGLWQQERDWRDWFFNPDKPGSTRPAPSKECKGCGALIPTRVVECPYCGHITEVKEKEYIEGTDIEINPIPNHLKNRYIGDLSPKEFYELVQIKNYKFGFVKRVCVSRGAEFTNQYGIIAGYKRGWNHYINTTDGNFKNFKII